MSIYRLRIVKGLLKLSVYFVVVLSIHGLLTYNSDRYRSFVHFPNLDKLNQSIEREIDVLMFGDSVSTHIADIDIDRRNLAQITFDQLPKDCLLTHLGEGAHEAGIYHAFVEYLIAKKAKTKLVVININLRSFQAAWDSRPEWQFAKEKIILRNGDSPWFPLLVRPLIVFKVFDLQPISQEAYFNEPVFDGYTQIGTVKDFHLDMNRKEFSELEYRNTVRYKYMGAIDPSHRKIKELESLIQKARAGGMKLFFFLTPIDYEEGVRVLGSSFLERVKKNALILTEMLDQHSVPHKNYSLLLPHVAFDYTLMNEHLNFYGRNELAKQLASDIDRELGGSIYRQGWTRCRGVR